MTYDHLGRAVVVPAGGARRIVSLVPSLTELCDALGCFDRLVGASSYCTFPARVAQLPKVGGQKDPDLEKIVGLRPDLVLLAKEENRERDAERLTQAGIPVYVTNVETVTGALALPRDLAGVLGAEEGRVQALTEQMEAGVQAARNRAQGQRRGVVMPVWRDPWILAGRDTYIDDVLAVVGGDNLGRRLDPRDAPRDGRRYPKVTLQQLGNLKDLSLVLLPSEPYPFTEADADELRAALSVQVSLCDGTVACWYGPRTARIVELADLLHQEPALPLL